MASASASASVTASPSTSACSTWPANGEALADWPVETNTPILSRRQLPPPAVERSPSAPLSTGDGIRQLPPPAVERSPSAPFSTGDGISAIKDLRARVDADLARGAGESQRLLEQAKRDAEEARNLAQPCKDWLGTLSTREVPPALAEMVQREVQTITSAECARYAFWVVVRLNQNLRAQVSDAVTTACKDQLVHLAAAVEEFKKLNQTSGRLEALERRVAELEARPVLTVEEAKAATEEADSNVQGAIDKYAERWETAWHEEVKARAQADAETTQRLEVFVRAGEAQHRSLEATLRRVSSDCQRSASTVERGLEELRAQVQAAAETEENARQEADSQLQMALWASDADLRALRGELQQEASTRAHTVTQLATGFEQLKAIVEQVLRIISQSMEPPPSAHGKPLIAFQPAPAESSIAHSSPPASPPLVGRVAFDTFSTATMADGVVLPVGQTADAGSDASYLGCRWNMAAPLYTSPT